MLYLSRKPRDFFYSGIHAAVEHTNDNQEFYESKGWIPHMEFAIYVMKSGEPADAKEEGKHIKVRSLWKDVINKIAISKDYQWTWIIHRNKGYKLIRSTEEVLKVERKRVILKCGYFQNEYIKNLKERIAFCSDKERLPLLEEALVSGLREKALTQIYANPSKLIEDLESLTRKKK